MARNWSPEERARQAEIIRRDRPWKKSTGPTSEIGKILSSANALKHGMRSVSAHEIRRLLRLQKDFLTSLQQSPPVK